MALATPRQSGQSSRHPALLSPRRVRSLAPPAPEAGLPAVAGAPPGHPHHHDRRGRLVAERARPAFPGTSNAGTPVDAPEPRHYQLHTPARPTLSRPQTTPQTALSAPSRLRRFPAAAHSTRGSARATGLSPASRLHLPLQGSATHRARTDPAHRGIPQGHTSRTKRRGSIFAPTT